MSVYKRKGIWHYDLTVNGVRRRGSTRQRGKADALKVEAKKRAAFVLGSDHRTIPTLRQAADRWVAARVAGRKSEVTTALRVRIMLRVMDGATLVSQIDTPDIEEAMNRRRVEIVRPGKAGEPAKGPTNSTVNRDLIDTTLRPILRYCRRVLKAPTQEIDWAELKLNEPRERTREFTGIEMSDWSGQLPPWHRPLHAFIARYGVRLREAFFPLSGFDVASGRVMVRKRKNGNAHSFPLLEEDARDIAARLGRAQAAGLNTVWFREMADGRLRPIEPRGFQAASRRALQAAGIPDARPVHDLRHHAATGFLRATGNLKATQRLLGHEQIASTARYAHADDAALLSGLRRVADTKEAEVAANPSPVRGRTGT